MAHGTHPKNFLLVETTMRRTTTLSATVVVALLASATTIAAQQQKEPFPGFDAYVNASLKAWKVPGASVALVRNDSVIYVKGYGVREVGKPAPVDEHTIFAIGSSSKAFTSAAVAMLVDSGKVNLDATATTYLPGFQLYDTYATREITVRDLLSHRSGLARGELIWYGSGYDRDEILRRVRYLPPSWSFRSQFGYQNIMFLAAGQVVAKVTGESWDDFIKQRIFQPLGMTSSSTSISALKGVADLAAPHADVNDTVRAIPYRNIDNIAPAGAVNSNAVDMAQWLKLQVGDGKFGGKQLISKRMVDEMHSPQTVIRLDPTWNAMNPSAHMMAYGLGWFLSDYEGKYLVQHGGNIDGMTALVAMLPEEKFGIVILSNMNGSQMPTALMLRAIDMQLKRPARDWSAQMRARADSMLARARAAQARTAQRVPNTKPSLALSEYVGSYADSAYGTVNVTEQNGGLYFAFGPTWKGPLEHWHYDTFHLKLDTPVLPAAPVTFHLNAAGKVEDMVVDLAGSVTFKRVPDRPRRAAAANTGSNPQ
jgi:CubicO group peptidase (beta-lactamase class C family)